MDEAATAILFENLAAIRRQLLHPRDFQSHGFEQAIRQMAHLRAGELPPEQNARLAAEVEQIGGLLTAWQGWLDVKQQLLEDAGLLDPADYNSVRANIPHRMQIEA